MSHTNEYDIIEIDVCVDCYVWHANGDLSGIESPERELEVIAAVGIDDGYSVEPGGSSEGDGHFSNFPCDSCRSPLGGHRYTAVMVAQLPTHITERKDS